MNSVTYILSTLCPGGGVEAFCQNAISSLNAHGWSTNLIVLGRFDPVMVKQFQTRGCQVDCLSENGQKDTFFALLRQYPRMKRLLAQRAGMVVHMHTCSHSVVLVLHCLKALKRPVRILHSHTSPRADMGLLRRLRYRAVRAYASRTATRFAACSRKAAEFLFTDRLIQEGAVQIIPNALDASRFSFDLQARMRKRSELHWKTERIIGCVGRLEEEKNTSFALELMPAVLQLDSQARLLLVGDGSLRAALEQQAERLGLSEHVFFAGRTERVGEYLCAMDVFLMPSQFEGMPMALLEARCSGLPSVVSEGVPAECCSSEECIRLPLSAPVRDWAEALTRPVHTPEERVQMGRECRKYGDLATMTEKLLLLYRESTETTEKRKIAK